MASKEKEIRKMLPKIYFRKIVAEDINTALTHFKNLTPIMDKYVYNDGTTKDLMCLSGTISTMFNDNTYNIPVSLWLEESYPQSAPIVYIQPTRDMMITKRTFISSNGEVLLPYQEDWKQLKRRELGGCMNADLLSSAKDKQIQGECDLLSLLQVMAAMFGECPPVCLKPHPEPEQAPCWLQFHREHNIYSRPDGSSYLSVPKDDGQPFHEDHETNC